MKYQHTALLSWILFCGAGLLAAMPLASQADDRRYRDGYEHRDHYEHRDRDRYEHNRHYKKQHPVKHKEHRIIHYGPPHHVPAKRIRYYRDVVIVRPYGHWYGGYGHYHGDDDAFKWLAFTAITLKLLDNLNEQQQREHEAAQVRATTVPIGERIIWRDGSASGYVTPTREGTSTAGRYCREFIQEVTIAGRSEQAYGTACRNADGSWEVVSTGTQ